MAEQGKGKASAGLKALNAALLVSFMAAVLVPLTGVQVHKAASTLFLLLCIVHTVVYRKRLGAKRFLLLGIIAASFITGIFGMIWEQMTIILRLHKVISVAGTAFLAVHIFVHRRYWKRS